MEQQLQVRQTNTLATFEEMERAATWVAQSELFGIKTPAQAMCLFLLCQSEGVHYIEAIRRYHLVDNKPAMRADYMLAKFKASGHKIIWHVRTDAVCAATLFAEGVEVDDESRKRAKQRFDLVWKLQGAIEDDDIDAVANIVEQIAEISREDEETILRTFDDAKAKGISVSFKKNEQTQKWEEKVKTNWKQSPRQMLTARVITEGVRLIAPELISGVYTPDEVEDIITNENRDRNQFIGKSLDDARPSDIRAMTKMVEQYQNEAKTATGARRSELLGMASEIRVKIAEMEYEADSIPGVQTVETEVLPARVEGELSLPGESPRVKIPWADYILQHVKPKKIQGKSLGSLVKDEIAVLYERSKYALEPDAAVDPQIKTEAEYIKEAYDEHNRASESQEG